tara:strand:- start:618 stop:1727 length:1110 start_codon:yes stop_codon:yes gene_type:complete
MKILYLTPNFSNYKASLYQFNTYKYLGKYCQLILWGPGFQNFDQNLNLSDVVAKFNLSKNDVICLGHAWLSDLPLNNSSKNQYSGYSWINTNGSKLNLNILEYCRKYNFSEFDGKKIIILNKEYISLEEKLKFIKENKFDLALCLNPNFKLYEEKTGVIFKFWPNAVDHLKFNKQNNYKYDLCFSGLIQNYNIDSSSKDSNQLRFEIFNEIFFQAFGLKILKKPKYAKYKIFWNSFSGRKYFDLILKIKKQYKYLAYDNYLELLSSSRSTLNTLGPSGLIGPRYFECMLSKSICFAEESVLYKKIFKEDENIVYFKKDLSDFKEKLNFVTSDSSLIKKIKNNAYDFVINQHTYDKRAQDLVKWVEDINK